MRLSKKKLAQSFIIAHRIYQNSSFDFKIKTLSVTKKTLLIIMLGLSVPPCSWFYLQNLQRLDGVEEQGVGVRGIEAAKPLPPISPSNGLWNSGSPPLLPHPWPCSQNVCYSISTMIYCYLPFYSPPFPAFLSSFICWGGNEKVFLI